MIYCFDVPAVPITMINAEKTYYFFKNYFANYRRYDTNIIRANRAKLIVVSLNFIFFFSKRVERE